MQTITNRICGMSVWYHRCLLVSESQGVLIHWLLTESAVYNAPDTVT